MKRNIGRYIRWLFSTERNATVRYWENRAKTFGLRAVLNLDHSIDDYDEVTEAQWKILSSTLREFRPSRVERILDFGCGAGRFTLRLAEYAEKAEVIGLDISATLLTYAPRCERVQYIRVEPGPLPFPGHHFDVVWVALVLGGITQQRALVASAAEIERVLRPGGLLILAESTSSGTGPLHWRSREANEYGRLFTQTDLKVVKTYEDLGEQISVMAGRKRSPIQS
jgi:ubiquinone/menaquinone biosynthesis C-methylase UbiE